MAGRYKKRQKLLIDKDIKTNLYIKASISLASVTRWAREYIYYRIVQIICVGA